MNKKILFFFWLIMVSVGPYIVYSNSNMELILSNRFLLVNYIQRTLGLMAFGAITFQITLGSNMDYFRKVLAGSALKFHIINGLFTYFLVFSHPLMWIVSNYFLRGRIDIYFPFVDVCLLCKSWLDWVYNFGRLGFWAITIAVSAGLLRGYDKFMRLNWRKFHVLNYFAFYFVSIHAYNLGSDSTIKLFLYFFWACQILVGYSIIKNLRKIPRLFLN